MTALSGKTIVLGITGGIACYKAAEVARLFVKAGADVHVVMTASAREFVTPLTFQTLTTNPVGTDLFSLTEESEIGHTQLPQRADLIVIAPATANFIGKAANGICDDLLTTMICAADAPILVCPAMNDRMWANAAVQRNVATLRGDGYDFIDPEEGELACKSVGPGRLADPTLIADRAVGIVTPKLLTGKKIVVTAGPTQESLDEVRYISNRSSGKMGYALARAARNYGAQVTLVSGPVDLDPPLGVELVRVRTALEMRDETAQAFRDADALVKCAAVADFRPAVSASGKLTKEEFADAVALERNPDIVAELAGAKEHRLVVGFAAQMSGDYVGRAKEKLAAKGLDFIVVNDVSRADIGFYSDENEVAVISPAGEVAHIDRASKDEIADRVLRIVFGLD
ncbi:MAG: bifunctional phosphopantothenoylcysteine decarboxylase/phosphopantothenate--cysteine ligase CoaBC [Deltaproteobacteria bacterium]|nr:bifunctional phosphopantothenoylcysteine decarboxylase/phosphopantothenate--cysteine ligase CoaBC [Deltaproteobacteria bacterium]